MKNLIIAVSVLVSLVSTSYSQLTELWRKSYTQEIESNIRAYAKDNAGNIIIGCSIARNQEGANFVILKFDTGGELLWRNEFNSAIPYHDHLSDVYVDGAGNIYATGVSTDYSTESTLRTVKYSSGGALLWQRTDSIEVKQQNNGITKEAFIKEGTDGSIYILTNRLGFLSLLKYNPNGTLLYTKDLDLPPGIAYMFARGLEINSHGLFMTSEFVDNTNYQYHQLVLKCSTSGDTAWTLYERFGNTFWEGPGGMTIDGNGNTYQLTQLMLGFTTSKMAVSKIGAGGGIVWTKIFGTGNDNYRVIPKDIKLDNAGNIIAAAENTYHVIGNNQYSEARILKYSQSGDLLWNRNIRSAEINDVAPGSICISADNSIYISGQCPMQSSSSQFVQKFTSAGDSVWNFNIQGVNYWSIGRYSSIENTGNVYLVSERQNGVMITKYGIPIGIQNINSEIPGKFSLSQNFPNPFNPVTNIEFSVPKRGLVKLVVFDMLGREVETLLNKLTEAGTYRADWNASEYPSGVYFYKLQTEGFSETKRMVLIK